MRFACISQLAKHSIPEIGTISGRNAKARSLQCPKAKASG